MHLAYLQAVKAYNIDEVAIGAIIVDESGNIVAQAYNQVEHKKSQLAHAEMQALAKVLKKKKVWRLNNLTMYVTLQPCLMCIGALYLSRITRVVYAIESIKFGVASDQIESIGIYKNLSTKIELLKYQPAADILQQFFKKRRKCHDEQSRVGKN